MDFSCSSQSTTPTKTTFSLSCKMESKSLGADEFPIINLNNKKEVTGNLFILISLKNLIIDLKVFLSFLSIL